MKIIVDAMGGTTRPSQRAGRPRCSAGAGRGSHPGGPGEDILKVLKEDGIGELPPGLRLSMPPRWWRCATTRPPPSKEKKDSSLTVGLNLLKNGDGRLCLRGQHRAVAVGPR